MNKKSKHILIRFIVCFILFLPILILQPDVQQLIGIGINHPIQNTVFFVLLFLMIVVGGWPVFANTIKGIGQLKFVPAYLPALALIGLTVYNLLVTLNYRLDTFYFETGILILLFVLMRRRLK